MDTDPFPITQSQGSEVVSTTTTRSYPRMKRVLVRRYRPRKRARTLVRFKPEMKMQDFNFQGNIADGALGSVVELTQIAEGSGANERHGNKIRIHRVEIRGSLGADNADAYLIQCHTTTVPSYASFIAFQGGHTTVDQSNTTFTEWRYLNGKYFKDHNGVRQSFRLGYTAKYNAALATSCVDNRLVFIIKNDTGAQITSEVSARVWYTDS